MVYAGAGLGNYCTRAVNRLGVRVRVQHALTNTYVRVFTHSTFHDHKTTLYAETRGK